VSSLLHNTHHYLEIV